MSEYILNTGCFFLRRHFISRGRKVQIRIIADRQSYMRDYCLPVRGDGNDGLWQIAGSFVKFRLWVDGGFIGLGPFRALNDVATVRHCFTVELPPGEHLLAVAHRGNGEGLSIKLENADFNSEWKAFNAGNIYMPVNLRHPAVDGYFKGDVGAGEYREHINGLLYPDHWNQPDFQDDSWDKPDYGESPFAIEESTFEYCCEKVHPASIRRTSDGHLIIDFGRELIGSPRLRGPASGGEVEVKLAEEMFTSERILSEFRGYMLCYQEIWMFKSGRQWLGNFGLREFRYAELVGYPDELDLQDIYVDCVHAPFDDQRANLHCPDDHLQSVWELCKYSVKATAMDVFTDCFHRERQAYEADSLINMPSYFAVGGDSHVARRTIEYLVGHPTWPLEWRLLLPHLFQIYYQETGDAAIIDRHFESLQQFCTRKDLPNESLIRNFPGNEVLIDWPKRYQNQYDFGEGEFLSVPNVLFGRTLQILSELALVTGREKDASCLHAKSQRLYDCLNQQCFSAERGLYIDHPTSTNTSLYANLWMLWCDAVPPDRIAGVLDHVVHCGLSCSLYSAFYYLDTLFRYGRSELAYSYLVREGRNSWLDMIQHGLTITSEYWYEPKTRMSLAHPWGASPAYLITRYVFGIHTLKPGWKEYAIQPLPTPLSGSGATLRLWKNGQEILSVL